MKCRIPQPTPHVLSPQANELPLPIRPFAAQRDHGKCVEQQPPLGRWRATFVGQSGGIPVVSRSGMLLAVPPRYQLTCETPKPNVVMRSRTAFFRNVISRTTDALILYFSTSRSFYDSCRFGVIRADWGPGTRNTIRPASLMSSTWELHLPGVTLRKEGTRVVANFPTACVSSGAA